MAAHLYPGIKSLHLVLDTPYDTIRTSDIRDDLASVKVWCSTTSGFTPSDANKVFDGIGLSITISNLTVNTTYYVKYAFVSAIEPAVYTTSSQLTAQVYDESTTVYGYLTNDSIAIATATNGTGGSFTLSTGLFKVYSLNTDVTGAGPVYSIVTSSGGITASIGSSTGIYSITAMSADIGSITISAIYNSITIQKVCNIVKVKAGVDGTNAISIAVKATGNAFLYKDATATTTSATDITISSTLQNITGTPTYTATAWTREAVSLGVISFTISGSNIVLSSTQFGQYSTVGYVLITASISTVSDTMTIYRINDGSEQITVEQTNQAHTISAYNDGTVPNANYSGSGTIIKVKQGNSYLDIDNTSPYNIGTWRITTITTSGITCDTTPTIGSDYINYDTHAAMIDDVAYIDYTITGTTTTNKAYSIVTRQSFSKSKAGAIGTTGATGTTGTTGATGAQTHRIYITAATSASTPATPATTTSGATPASWSASPVSLTGTQAQFQSDGTTPAASTTTTWSTPYLSYFKVAQLSAITADIGNLTIGTGGNISSGKNSGTSTAAGFWLGNETAGSVPKFKIGDASDNQYLEWNGTDFTVKSRYVQYGPSAFTGGMNINSTAAQTFYSLKVENTYDTAISAIHGTAGNWPTAGIYGTAVGNGFGVRAIMGPNNGVAGSFSYGTTDVSSDYKRVDLADNQYAINVITGTTKLKQTVESLSTGTISSNAVTLNFNAGAILVVGGTGTNFTVNLTNIPVVANTSIVLTVSIVQGGTACIPSAITINATAVTIKWLSSTVPTGNANKVDLVGFVLIYTSGWTVLGSLSSYG